MLAKFAPIALPLVFLVSLGWGLALPAPAAAQFFSDPGDQEGFVESDDQFFEDDRQGGLPPAAPGPQRGTDDFTDGGRFIDEDAPVAPQRGSGNLTIDRRRTELRLQGERESLPLNTAWGAGTGLVIGSWFALIEGGDDRDTQRFIGMGIVLGAILGITLGMKTLIAPSAPSAVQATPPPKGMQAVPLVAFSGGKAQSLRMGLALRF